MSFILESIKQAERERNIGQAPSITIQHSLSQEEMQNSWLRWGLPALVVTALALFAWGATKTLQLNKRYQGQKYSLNQELNNSENKQSTNVAKEALSQKSTDNKQESNKSIAYVARKDLHHSKLQEVQDINLHEEALLEGQDKDELVQIDAVDTARRSDTKVVAQEITEPVKDKLDTAISQDKIYALYSELAATANNENFAEDNVEHQNSSLQHESSITPENKNTIIENENLYDESTVVANASLEPISVTPLQFATAVNTGVISFGELPYDIQQQVPELRISVHMFNIEPSQRRIRINGRMYTEGAAMQDELALVEITPYGAVFDYQGHTFHLNVR